MADARLDACLEALGADLLVTADPGIVLLATGHVGDIETGPSVFAPPPIAVVPLGGDALLVCSADEAPAGDSVEAYEGFTIGPLAVPDAAVDALRRALDRAAPRARRVAVDGATTPAAIAAALPGEVLLADRELRAAVAAKRPDEVAAIERAVAIAGIGQDAARRAVIAGASELEAWAHVSGAMQQAAGARVPTIADLVTGPRTAEIGGPPGPRVIGDGDGVICDIIPRVDGWWGDSCAAWIVGGEPADDETVRMHAACRTALDAGVAALQVGATAADVDRICRSIVAEAGYAYPHHTGHGVGFHWHEEPRIVPASGTVLAPGMIVALEPGAYDDVRGVRVEVVVEVTADGPRVLSQHALGLGPDAA